MNLVFKYDWLHLVIICSTGGLWVYADERFHLVEILWRNVLLAVSWTHSEMQSGDKWNRVYLIQNTDVVSVCIHMIFL